jgi:dihydroneopterin aldolase
VTDRIEVRGLRVMARCGVLPEEVERDQPFEIDLDVAVDLAAAGASDQLADTVDYGSMVDRVVEATNGHHGLMEAMANDIATSVLADARVGAVTVTVRKLRPPVPHDLASAGVTLHRTTA